MREDKAMHLAEGGGLRERRHVGLGVLVEIGAVAVAGDDDDTEDLRHDARGGMREKKCVGRRICRRLVSGWFGEAEGI